MTASALPAWGAIDDSSVGLSGGRLVVPFIVKVDAATDDPYTILALAAPRGHSIQVASGISETLARRFQGLFCVELEMERQLNATTWRAHAIYAPASDRTIGLWRRSVRFASETRPFTWSLPELTALGNPRTDIGRSKRVGMRQFRQRIVGTTATPGDPATSVYNAGDDPVFPTGRLIDVNMSVNDGITSYIYEILAPQLTHQQTRQLSSLKWHTNKYPWLGDPTWSGIFSNWECHDEVLVLPGTRAGVAWYSNVALEFLFRPIDKDVNPYGWRATVINDVVKFDNGVSLEVIDTSSGNAELSSQVFIQYPEVGFDEIFSIVGYGSPQV